MADAEKPCWCKATANGLATGCPRHPSAPARTHSVGDASGGHAEGKQEKAAPAFVYRPPTPGHEEWNRCVACDAFRDMHRDGFASYRHRFVAPVPVAPASGQDQEPPAWATNVAVELWGLGKHHERIARLIHAAYLASPEARPTQVICTHCGYFATEVPVRPRDEQVVALVSRVQVLEAALRQITDEGGHGNLSRYIASHALAAPDENAEERA